jgi:hypothetical protein
LLPPAEPAVAGQRSPNGEESERDQEIEMTSMTRVIAMLGVMGVTVVGAPALATAGTATFYELTENMKLVRKNNTNNPVGRRISISALTGVAKPGTPLCANVDLASGPAGCAVNALGSDNVSLESGLGTLSGNFATVIQGDNPVDGPEAIVLRGEFKGQMDFSPAILHQIPFGTVVGKVRPEWGRATEFTGIFRLPFAGNVETEVEVAPGVKVKLTLRQLFCPATPNPNPWAELYGGVDLTYLDNVEAATTPSGRCLDIQPNELSLGTPLVRWDIEF